jgi:hypothetical protein
MKRFVVLLAISAGLGALGTVACGGGADKPPLTPDTTENPLPPEPDAGAMAPAPAAPAAPEAPAK